MGSFPLMLLGNSGLELAISPSFFRPIFFFFLEVERGAEAAFGDTAVPRNCDEPHVADWLPLREGKAWWSRAVFFAPLEGELSRQATFLK